MLATSERDARADQPRALEYDVKLERMDVAIRAVVLVTVGKWSNREQAARLGLDRDTHGKELQRALEELRASGAITKLRTDDEVFALVRRCPFLVEAAQVALGLYQAVTYSSREVYFRKRCAR